MRLQGKSTLIAGVPRRIDRAFPETVAREGARVAVTNISGDAARATAAELGLQACVVDMGVVDTPMWDRVDAMFPRFQNLPIGQKKREVGLVVPFGCMGTAADLTGMAIFRASSEAYYIVAQTYNVDGGNWMS